MGPTTVFIPFTLLRRMYSSGKNPRCFFDIQAEGDKLGNGPLGIGKLKVHPLDLGKSTKSKPTPGFTSL